MSNIKQVLSNLDKRKEEIIDSLQKGVKLAALHLEGAIKDKTPVDSGNLQGSIVTGRTKLLDGKITVPIGTNFEYAPHVEYGVTATTKTGKARKNPYEYHLGENVVFKGTGAGMFRKSIDEEQDTIIDIIKKGG